MRRVVLTFLEAGDEELLSNVASDCKPFNFSLISDSYRFDARQLFLLYIV